MDNSQSSDVSDYVNQSLTVPAETNTINMNTYETLLNKTKTSLCNDTSTWMDTPICDYFTLLLQDCYLCISQTLKLLDEFVLETDVQAQKLSHFLDNAVDILQLLSSFIKKIIESVSMSCSTMKTFPTTTGQIIVDIFIHCRNSEAVYGDHLASIQQQLKDLFRTCHELQLTYLMVIEKHFIFDHTNKEELLILVEALNINLHIGEVAQTLDIKTMAEQWKAYTMICEKYVNYLMDSSIYYDCTNVLCSMVSSNIIASMEVEQEDKLIMRSMKLTNFMIKILLKVCTIFKHSKSKPYQRIVDLLINLYLHNPSYLETLGGKSQQFTNIMSANVLNPADVLVNELLCDESFIHIIINYKFDERHQDDEVLGYIILMVTLMRLVSQKSDRISFPRREFFTCLFKMMPDCYVWLNIGMKFNIDVTSNSPADSIGLFEYILIHSTCFALSMNNQEYCGLEKIIFEALFRVDSISPLFAANLWIMLTRVTNNKQLLFTQLMFLCQTYLKLGNAPMFSLSPQRVHLERTMTSLFELLDIEDRVRLYKQYNPSMNQNNVSLWAVLKIRNLPVDLQRIVEKDIVEKIKTVFFKSMPFECHEKLIGLIKVTRLVATCSCNILEGLEGILLEGWSKACPQNLTFLSDTMDLNTMWFFEYIEALVSLTNSMVYSVYGRSSHVVKILHVISGLIQRGNAELSLLLMNLLCKLAANPIHDENKMEAEKIINKTFKKIIQDGDDLVKRSLFSEIRTYNSKYLELTINSIISGNQTASDVWQQCATNNTKTFDYTKLRDELNLICNFKYRHKCLELGSDTKGKDVGFVDKIDNSCSSNFDLADIDSLFSGESDGEPASKRVKLDTEEIDSILDRLERDISLLSCIKENIITEEHKNRIRLLRDKLTGLVT
ncbi:unnamed protein product [Chilo suppressalis]|uniref:Uncharacterized protein n=1 Tax=Chilo suppressalis TaxID=168631 RepID=A0ABN8B4R9_CHISP|nr:unnamed protein product [Chilo suppressalis]